VRSVGMREKRSTWIRNRRTTHKTFRAAHRQSQPIKTTAFVYWLGSSQGSNGEHTQGRSAASWLWRGGTRSAAGGPKLYVYISYILQSRHEGIKWLCYSLENITRGRLPLTLCTGFFSWFSLFFLSGNDVYEWSTLKLMLHIVVGLRNIMIKRKWRDSLQAWVVKNNNFRNSGKQLSGLRGL